MDDKDYLAGFEGYLERHEGLDTETAERFRPIADGLDEDFFAFIMTNVVL